MITVLATLVVCVYMLALLFIFLQSLTQAYLLVKYLRNYRSSNTVAVPSVQECPAVTVQLPVYNEWYVVERLIDSVAQLDYPADKLEIQVLDDSTDESAQRSSAKVNDWKLKGVNIAYIHRQNREGFKAGALANGLELSKGEFLAVFDADFVPEKNFLKETVPFFNDEEVGLVQSRWSHINKNYSLLTKLQAFGLDAHFTIEQTGRNSSGCFINFNGTAGIWRKQAILDAGNWHSDTLTEDLDLSYRAQMAGWKFVYLQSLVSPAELPPVMSAVKSQQYRWVKGGAETARKHLMTLFNSKISVNKKWHGMAHLLNSGIFIAILVTALLSVPMLLVKQAFPALQSLINYASFFLCSFVIFAAVYAASSITLHKLRSGIKIFLTHFPLFLSVSMALSLHNSIAVLEGYAGRRTPFIRTPKFNITNSGDNWNRNRYTFQSMDKTTWVEMLLLLYFSAAIALGIYLHDYGLIPFHLLLVVGLVIVLYNTAAEHFQQENISAVDNSISLAKQ